MYPLDIKSHLEQLDADARKLKARRGYVKDFGRLFGFQLTDEDVSDADAAGAETLFRSIADRRALREQIRQTAADARQVPQWISNLPNVRVG